MSPFMDVLGFIGKPVAPGGGGSATASASFEGTWRDSDTASNNASNYTFSGLSFGTAAANRLIVAGIHNTEYISGPADQPSSVTIGGVSATNVVINVDNEACASIWQALVPSGTTGSVVVNFPATQQNCGVGIWSIVTNRQAAQFSSSSDNGASIAATIPTSGYGVVVCTVDPDAATTTVTPTNYTEDYENDLADHATFEGGHLTASATITATAPNKASGESLVYASWGP